MKKLNKKGFTLAELLIVVAIVAVLVAISIPIFNGKLNKAKLATNQANIRAAKAAAVADYLTEGETKMVAYTYDVAKGTIAKIGETKGDVEPAMVSGIDEEPKDKVFETIGVTIKGETIETKPTVEEVKKDLGLSK